MSLLEKLQAEVSKILALAPAPATTLAAGTPDPDVAAGYDFVKEESGVRIYRLKGTEGSFTAVKGVTFIKKSPSELANFVFYTAENRSKWDDSFENGRTVEVLTDDAATGTKAQVEYSAYKSGSMMVTNRDFCTGRLLGKLPNDEGYYIVATSVEHKDCPEVKGFVRAESKQSGWVFRAVPEQPGVTAVTSVTCVDPKGWIPAAVVNSVATKNPLSLARLRDVIEKL
jgi:hypothetical protein